jgi:hypothetical protein
MAGRAVGAGRAWGAGGATLECATVAGGAARHAHWVRLASAAKAESYAAGW